MVTSQNYGRIEDYSCKIMVVDPEGRITENTALWLHNPVHALTGKVDPVELIIKRIAKASTHTILRTVKVTVNG